jgi:hypothetical protein
MLASATEPILQTLANSYAERPDDLVSRYLVERQLVERQLVERQLMERQLVEFKNML